MSQLLCSLLALLCLFPLVLGYLQSGTVFGDLTFVPEVLPLSVRGHTDQDGQIHVRVHILYTDDWQATWFACGINQCIMKEKKVYVQGRVPAEQLLDIELPQEYFHSEIVDAEEDDILEEEDGDFLVGKNELFLKLCSSSSSQAAVLRIPIGGEFSTIRNIDNDTFPRYVPKYPEMSKISDDVIIVQPGLPSQASIGVLFSEDDRFTVRGIVYNSTSKKIFTTMWTTDYGQGYSIFTKIPINNDDLSQPFDDFVGIKEFPEYEIDDVRIAQISINIPTQNNDITGVFRITGHHEQYVESFHNIFEASLEQVLVVKRATDEHGPFPEAVLDFQGGEYDQERCIQGKSCFVSCQVLGTNIEHVDLLHKNSNSQFLMMNRSQHVLIGPYEAKVTTMVNTNDPMASGTYLCQASSGPVTITKEIDVLFTNVR